MNDMNIVGITIAGVSFFLIGLFHFIVIKTEYYFSDKCWPLFLVCGCIFIIISIMISNTILSSICGILGCSCLWSIGELKEQSRRVERGWFPQNPKRNK